MFTIAFLFQNKLPEVPEYVVTDVILHDDITLT